MPSEGNDRLVAVFKILHENSKKIITTLESGKIPTQIENIHIKKSITIERELLRNRLLSLGYTQVELVTQEGEFSEHGWVFDVWGIGEEYPVRVEFFW